MLGKNTVLALWTNYFDEVAATALAIAFHKLGTRVKLVGPARSKEVGTSGLTLVPDVALERAISMAKRTIIVIISGAADAVHGPY